MAALFNKRKDKTDMNPSRLARGNMGKRFIKNFITCWQLHLFLLPAVAYILIFKYYPMLGAQIAFKDFSPVSGIWGSPWVGLKHFIRFIESFYFERVMVNTLRISLYTLIAGITSFLALSTIS